jgi:hypothetical protein
MPDQDYGGGHRKAEIGPPCCRGNRALKWSGVTTHQTSGVGPVTTKE